MSAKCDPANPETRNLYERLLDAVKAFGPYKVNVRKYSLLLTRKTAFAGVHPRPDFLILTVKTDAPIEASRVLKAEQVSNSRWNIDLRLSSAAEIDAELLGWLRRAYDLCG